MATEGRQRAIIDTSVLINFLRSDRVDLLAAHPAYCFVVIDYVRREVTNRYHQQLARLEATLAAGLLESDIDPADVSMEELTAYAELQRVRIATASGAQSPRPPPRGTPSRSTSTGR